MRFAIPVLSLLLLVTAGCGESKVENSATPTPIVTGPTSGAPPMTGGAKKGGDVLIPPPSTPK